MVIFRENSEDIYAGIEWEAESDKAKKLIKFLIEEMGVKKIRFPNTSGIGIKPVSREGTERLVRKAIQYAIDNDKPSVTIVHKGNIMKFTEGGFRDWAYALAQKEFGAKPIDGGPWCKFKNPKTGKDIIVKDVIADAFLQQILLRPAEYSVIATLNLNGDYISDALAAQVGGIGIAPGANLSRYRGHVRGHPRHGAQVRRQGLREPGFRDPVGRDDAAPHGLEGSGRPDHQLDREIHPEQEGDLRLRPPDGRRYPGQLLRLRPGDDREHVKTVVPQTSSRLRAAFSLADSIACILLAIPQCRNALAQET